MQRRIVVFKVVKLRKSAEEVRLRCRGAGVFETHFPDWLRLAGLRGRYARPHEEQYAEDFHAMILSAILLQ
jgi:hypothetical protein